MQGSHIKNLFSQTLTYGLGLFINRFFSFLLIPLYTYIYSPADLGLLNIIQSIWLIVIIFYLYGLETSFVKFFTSAKDKSEKCKIYSTTLLLVLVTSLIFSITIFLLSDTVVEKLNFENPVKALFLFKLLPFLLFFDTMSRIPLLILRSDLQAKKYFRVTILTLFLNIILNILFVLILKIEIEAIFYVYLITMFMALLYGLYLTREYILYSFDKFIAGGLFKFGNKFIFIGLFILAIDISDRLFLKYYFDESLVGIYSTNYKLASAMGLAISAFKFSWTPYFLNIAESPENKKIVSDVFTYYMFTGLFLFLTFAFLLPPIVSFDFNGFSLLNKNFWSGLNIIPIILLSYFVSGIYASLNAAPFFADKTSYIFFVTLIGFITNIVFNFFLIPLFGMYGAAWATVLSYVIMSGGLYLLSQKIFKIDYDYKKLFIIVIVTVITYVIQFYFCRFDHLTNIVFSIALLLFFLFTINSLKVVEMRKLLSILKKQ